MPALNGLIQIFHSIHPAYSISGFIVGLLVGLTGVGGGSLMTPLLVIMFGIPATTAVGTDLLYACITKGVGTTVHGFSRTVEWPIVLRLSTGSVPGTALTLIALSHFQTRTTGVSTTITTVLGCALILTAVSIIFRKFILNSVAEFTSKLTARQTNLFTIILGAVLGVLVSISSVGAGAIGVTFLLILYPNLPAGKIVGSDIAHAVPLTLVAGIGHWLLGSVDGLLLASLLVGSLPGIVIGSYISSRVPDKVLRPILAGTLAAVGARLSF